MSKTAQQPVSLVSERLHPCIGLRVTGLDLSRPLSRETVAAIHALWMEGLLLVFPAQAISDAQHVRFGRCFGDLEIHPSVAHRASGDAAIYRVSNVAEDGSIVPSRDSSWQYLSQSWRWHTDSSFREVPSTGSILHGIETTRSGGDTLFANMYAAYDDLPDATKRRIEGLWVVHDHDHILSLTPDGVAGQDRDRYEHLPPVSHPLVRVHPVTGRRSLFLSPHTMTAIDGMAQADARALLDSLIDHAVQERYVYRHRWTPHDVIMWDNRCTMHSVEPFDNERVRRIMHRVTLAGQARPSGVQHPL